MGINHINEELKKFELFNALETAQLEIISNIVFEKEFQSKDLIIEQHDTSDLVYFILEGHIKVYLLKENGKEINLAIVGPYETLGEIAMVTKKERSANCEAIDKVKCFVMKGSDMEKAMLNNPKIAVSFLRYFAGRIIKANKHIEELTTASLKNRVHTLLASLTKNQANATIDITQETIAEILSATRPRVTEVLQELADEKKIKVLRGQIRVLREQINSL